MSKDTIEHDNRRPAPVTLELANLLAPPGLLLNVQQSSDTESLQVGHAIKNCDKDSMSQTPVQAAEETGHS